MDENILKAVMEYGVFAVLFFYMLNYMIKQHEADKKDARDREDKLIDHIKKSDETHLIIANKVEEVSKNMNDMQKNMASMQTALVFVQKDIDELKNKD